LQWKSFCGILIFDEMRVMKPQKIAAQSTTRRDTPKVKLYISNLKLISMNLTWKEFERVEMRVGTVVTARDYPEAQNPVYRLTIDFGAQIGILKSSAQITARYSIADLEGKQVIAVVNFPKKQIGKMMSECLILGSVGAENDIVLLSPDFKVKNGLRIG